MTLAGTIRNGVVVLDDPPALTDGTRVRVIVPSAEKQVPDSEQPTLRNLLKVAGIVKGMPADFAEQHDHYIHGTPKK